MLFCMALIFKKLKWRKIRSVQILPMLKVLRQEALLVVPEHEDRKTTSISFQACINVVINAVSFP